MSLYFIFFFFFFFNDTATTEIYTLSLHDALPISTSETDHYWHNWIYLPSPRPTVAIGAPADGLKVRPGEPVAFAAMAPSATEGVASTRLRWTSSRDGQTGTGAGFMTTGLSPRVHH